MSRGVGEQGGRRLETKVGPVLAKNIELRTGEERWGESSAWGRGVGGVGAVRDGMARLRVGSGGGVSGDSVAPQVIQDGSGSQEMGDFLSSLRADDGATCSGRGLQPF